MEHNVIGKSLAKVDALNKVLGRAKYADDIEFPSMLHAKLLRSKYPHARILSIDTSKAEKLPGVKAVITAKDIPVNTFGIFVKDQYVLAEDRVRYFGEPIAAVAAESEGIAEEALEMIDVKFKELPSVFDAKEALRPTSPKVHEGGNLAAHRKIRFGDVEKGFSMADEVIEDTFSTQKVEHCHMEPRAGIAIVDANGRVTVWSALPLPSISQAELARVLGLPITKVRIIQPECGGSFGGRNEISFEPIVAVLAMKTKCPVKMVWSREEEFVGSTTRHSYYFEYKTGVTKDGYLVAREVKIISDTGAYTSFGESQLTKACIHATGPYRIPHIKVDGYLVFTNNPVAGAMRGFGVPQVMAAEETHMEHIARHLKIDSIELRLKNALKDGDQTATGQVLHSVGLTETILKAAEVARWDKTPLENRSTNGPIRRGRGVACMFYPIGVTEKPNASSAFVRVNADGTVNVIVGAVDVGQGSKTALTQIAAEELGVPMEDVILVTGDSDVDPYEFGSVASRVTYAAGNAVRLTVASAKKMLLEAAAEKFAVTPEALEIKNRMIYVKGSPEKGMSLKEAVLICQGKGRPVVAVASFNPPNTLLDQETGRGNPFPTYVYATQIADVEVDTRTGLVKVSKIVAAHDVGKAINPALVRGQIIGGIGFGLGQALMENMLLVQGRDLNPNFLDYIIPTAMDMPEVEAIIVEKHEPTGPFGAKGIGEASNVPTAPAIINAIYDAVGVLINDLPATPEKVLKALRKKELNPKFL
jgi:CO/xanthine dehydrogenase Mo-binding subunit